MSDHVVDESTISETRSLVNDACALAGIPFPHGSIFRFEGQVTTFAGDDDEAEPEIEAGD